MTKAHDFSTCDFSIFSDLELVRLQKEAREVDDKDFLHAILVELGKRQGKHQWPEETDDG